MAHLRPHVCKFIGAHSCLWELVEITLKYSAKHKLTNLDDNDINTVLSLLYLLINSLHLW